MIGQLLLFFDFLDRLSYKVLTVSMLACCPAFPTLSALSMQVVEESEQVFGPNPSLDDYLPSTEQLRGLQFTEACLRETLRKYRYSRVYGLKLL